MKVVIAGASGFMGTRFSALYRARGDQVSTIGRRSGSGHADAAWRDQARIGRLLDGADILVNLAGKSVNCRYTETNLAEILRSRLETTTELCRVVGIIDNPPTSWEKAFFDAPRDGVRQMALRMPVTLGDGSALRQVRHRERVA